MGKRMFLIALAAALLLPALAAAGLQADEDTQTQATQTQATPTQTQTAQNAGVWFTGLFEETTFIPLSEIMEMEPRYVTVTMVGHSIGYAGRCTYKGATLKDVMMAAGYTGTRDPDVGIEDMIRVIGSDGYGCVLSWAEAFDQDDSRNIILAYEKDGKPLDEGEGPIRLVTANDSYIGRYIKDVVQVDAVTGYMLPPKE